MKHDLMERNQQLTSSAKELNALALRDNREAQDRLDNMIAGCFVIQKLYGRQPENIEVINRTFHSTLSNYPAASVIRAFETWMQRSQEFPTPADIVSLIRRNGKPPLKESDIIAIRKKDGQDRTAEDWQLLKEWDAQQQEGWKEFTDPKKEEATLQENFRLREQVKQLENEVARLTGLLYEARMTKGLERPKQTVEEKVRNTIAAMRAAGGSEADIEAFAKEYGIAG